MAHLCLLHSLPQLRIFKPEIQHLSVAARPALPGMLLRGLLPLSRMKRLMASAMQFKKPARKPTVAPVPTEIAAIKTEPMLRTPFFTTGEVRAVESAYSPSDEPTMFSIPYDVSHLVSPAKNGRTPPFRHRKNETKDGLDTRSTIFVGLESEKTTTLREVGHAQGIPIEECETNVIVAVPESVVEGMDRLVSSQSESLNPVTGDRKMYQPGDRVEVAVEGINGSKAWKYGVALSPADEAEVGMKEFEGAGSFLL